MKPLLLAAFFACIAIAAHPQNYKPLQAGGTIPKEFVTKSSAKYHEEKQNLQKTEEKKTQKIKSAFYLESTFSIDNLLKSGYVLFNDPVSDYVNKVAGEILKANPEIKDELRFYTLKSTAVNAFSTSDGMVLINLGLLAQIENEAQLAFILCHEISHCLEKHAMENYIHKEEVSKGKGVYKKLSFDEKMVEKMRYSKDNEEEADKMGFELYLKTKYSFEALSGAFDVLQYAHLPIDNIPFNYSLLESSNLKLPEEYKLAEVNPISTEEEDEDEDESTHPSVSTRRQYIADEAKDKPAEGRVKFIFPEAEFGKAQTTARNELMRLYIINRDYETAIYHASILLEKEPGAQYLEEALGRALYGMAFYCGGNDFSDVHREPEKTEGYLHQTVHLFDKLDGHGEEAAIIALRYMLALKKKYPMNASNEYYADRLVKLLVEEHDVEWDYFLSETLEAAKKKAEETAADTAAKDEQNLSKYDKIKKQSVVEAPTVNYIKYALADYKTDSDLKKVFAKHKKEDKKDKPLSSKEKKAIARRGYALNIKKVLVFDPLYAFIDERKKESYRYLESEKGQEEFSDRIEDISKRVGLKVSVLDAGKITSSDIEDFNDFAFLTEYINERFRHSDDMNLSTIERDRVLAFTKKYDTPYVNLTAMIYMKQNANRGLLMALSIIYPVILPFTLPKMISSGKNCYYLDLLYNLETDELVFSEAYNIYASDQPYLVNSHLYHTLHQIKSAKK